MNRKQRRQKVKTKQDYENLRFILHTLEEFNKLSAEEKINAIKELKKELGIKG